MIESIEYLVFQLLANEIQTRSVERKLIFSIDKTAISIYPAHLINQIKYANMPGDGNFYVYAYDSHHLQKVIQTIMMLEPERFELNKELINEVLQIEDQGFQSMYLKGFYKDLLGQVIEEKKDLSVTMFNEIQDNLSSFSKMIDGIVELEFKIDKNKFWEQLIGYKPIDINLIAFDGWDGNSKEILIQDQKKIYQIQMIYS